MVQDGRTTLQPVLRLKALVEVRVRGWGSSLETGGFDRAYDKMNKLAGGKPAWHSPQAECPVCDDPGGALTSLAFCLSDGDGGPGDGAVEGACRSRPHPGATCSSLEDGKQRGGGYIRATRCMMEHAWTFQ